jgi:hypothetical protein
MSVYVDDFDIAKSKRRLAVDDGAVEVTMQDLVRRIRARREPAAERSPE